MKASRSYDYIRDKRRPASSSPPPTHISFIQRYPRLSIHFPFELTPHEEKMNTELGDLEIPTFSLPRETAVPVHLYRVLQSTNKKSVTNRSAKPFKIFSLFPLVLFSGYYFVTIKSVYHQYPTEFSKLNVGLCSAL